MKVSRVAEMRQLDRKAKETSSGSIALENKDELLELSTRMKMVVLGPGLSGDLAAKEKGPDGMIAQDILDFLPYAVQYYRENLARISENLYDTICVV